eukprot:6194414-Pleurochrysis_carterae.AAC.2
MSPFVMLGVFFCVARVAQLDSLYVEERRMIERLQNEVSSLKAAQREAKNKHDTDLGRALATQAKLTREAEALRSDLKRSTDKAADDLANARAAFSSEIQSRVEECEALRLRVDELKGDLELAGLQSGSNSAEKRRMEREMAAARQESAAAVERNEKLLQRAAAAERELATLREAQSDAAAAAAAAEAAAAAAAAAELTKASSDAVALEQERSLRSTAETKAKQLQAELTKLRSELDLARAEVERSRRDLMKLEREASEARSASSSAESRAADAAADARVSAAAAQATGQRLLHRRFMPLYVSEPWVWAKVFQLFHASADRVRSLEQEVAELRRQLSSVGPGSATKGQSNFQEFVALKREIANLRATNAAMMRQLSGSGAPPPEPIGNILSRHTEIHSQGSSRAPPIRGGVGRATAGRPRTGSRGLVSTGLQ